MLDRRFFTIRREDRFKFNVPTNVFQSGPISNLSQRLPHSHLVCFSGTQHNKQSNYHSRGSEAMTQQPLLNRAYECIIASLENLCIKCRSLTCLGIRTGRYFTLKMRAEGLISKFASGYKGGAENGR